MEDAKDELAAWVMDRRDPWKQYVDENHLQRWNEYYRLWKGVHIQEDSNYESEKSKLIAPALSQAVESSVAEIEEAIFGEKWWFDIENDNLDENPEHTQYLYAIRNQLKEDLESSRFRQVAVECFLNAAIFGSGLCKIMVETKPRKSITDKPLMVEQTMVGLDADVKEEEIVNVKFVAIDPREFIPDSSGKSIEDCLGVIHETLVPTHVVEQRMNDGVYDERAIGTFTWDIQSHLQGESTPRNLEDYTKITEWHGKVPTHLLEESEEADDYTEDEDDMDVVTSYTEAIITIANDSVVVKKRKNPFLMQDRSIIKFDWDKVPNKFWGRGVCEKGYNPQKALDAELRGRIDAMALQIRPMMAIDATMMPRGSKFDVKAGRSVAVNGDPRGFAAPLGFGDVSASTFHQTGELERMVQMGTGAMDSATPVGVNARNSTASGMSMIQGGAIKRQKRTVRNVSWDFIVPIIEKSLWRYQQFDPDRYPPVDLKFKPISTLGIMARELENQQITNLLQTTQPGSPGWWLLLRSIYQNSSLQDKDKLIQIAEENYTQASNPEPSPEEQQMQQLAMEEAFLKNEKIKAEIEVNKANALTMMENSKQSTDGKDAGQMMLKNKEIESRAQTEKYKADIKSSTDKEIALLNAQLKQESQKPISINMSEEVDRQTSETISTSVSTIIRDVIGEFKDLTDNNNQEMANAVKSLGEGLSDLSNSITKPKRLITDKDGMPIGVETIEE